MVHLKAYMHNDIVFVFIGVYLLGMIQILLTVLLLNACRMQPDYVTSTHLQGYISMLNDNNDAMLVNVNVTKQPRSVVEPGNRGPHNCV